MIRTIFAMFMLTAFAVAVAAQTPENVTIRAGQQKSAANGGLKIKFLSVEEDSRCPKDTNCIWAGVARIKIELSRNSKKSVFELNTNELNKPAVFQGYDVVIKRLDPYPSTQRTTRIAEYSLTLTISTSRK